MPPYSRKLESRPVGEISGVACSGDACHYAVSFAMVGIPENGGWVLPPLPPTAVFLGILERPSCLELHRPRRSQRRPLALASRACTCPAGRGIRGTRSKGRARLAPERDRLGLA